MTGFALLASLMLLAALAAIAWPLLRERGKGQSTWPVLLVAGIALPLLAIPTYRALSNWSWSETPQGAGVAPAVEEMVGRLETRLQGNPRDVEGWLMLGRSYFQLSRFPEAVGAYQRAYALTQGRNVEAVLGLGETLAFADERMLVGRSADLFEQAFTLAPSHPKVLWYSGLAAYRKGNVAVARDRWTQLIALEPPAEVKRVLAEAIAGIDQQLAGADTNSAPSAAPGTRSAAVRVRVSIAPQLANQVPAQAPLFVLVRAEEGGGPPLAVTRRAAAELPVLVELTDRDAMVAGRGLSGAERVTVVARVARSGEPIARSGDLEGRVSYDVRSGTPVDLIINSTVP